MRTGSVHARLAATRALEDGTSTVPVVMGLDADLEPTFAQAYGVAGAAAGADPVSRVADLAERPDGDLVLAGIRDSGRVFALVIDADGGTDCGGDAEATPITAVAEPITPLVTPTGETYHNSGMMGWPELRVASTTTPEAPQQECRASR